MVIKASQRHFDDEEESDESLELVAVTYVGGRQHYLDNAVRQQGYWPSYGGFTRGITEVAFVPDRGLGFFENHADFEIEYTREAIAEALLDKNYLAPEVFQAGAGGGEERSRILDKLGIEKVETTNEGIREQLADAAGLEEDPGSDTALSLADELAHPDDGYTRDQLKSAVEELRDGPDEVSLQQGKTDFAEWLAGQVGEDGLSQQELHDVIRGDA